MIVRNKSRFLESILSVIIELVQISSFQIEIFTTSVVGLQVKSRLVDIAFGQNRQSGLKFVTFFS